MDGSNTAPGSPGQNHADEVRMPDRFFSKFDPSKLIDLIIGKQTQYYTLWAVYTVVQFSAGGFVSSRDLSLWAVMAVLLAVWTFNLGHLGFVLQCVEQISKLRIALNCALAGTDEGYQKSIRNAFKDMNESNFFWTFYKNKEDRHKYAINSFVHFLIDTCASVALLSIHGYI